MKPVDLALRIQAVSGPPTLETLPAEPLGGRRFRLLHTPGMVLGVAAGDVVELTDERTGEFAVRQRAGNVGVQFFVRDVGEDLRPECVRDLDAAIRAIGGWVG